MAGMSFESLRVGEQYKLINFSETFEFTVKKKLSEENFILKDIHTLEEYELQDLIKYGKGKDYDLYELDVE
jgi:hypothetical protein